MQNNNLTISVGVFFYKKKDNKQYFYSYKIMILDNNILIQDKERKDNPFKSFNEVVDSILKTIAIKNINLSQIKFNSNSDKFLNYLKSKQGVVALNPEEIMAIAFLDLFEKCNFGSYFSAGNKDLDVRQIAKQVIQQDVDIGWEYYYGSFLVFLTEETREGNIKVTNQGNNFAELLNKYKERVVIEDWQEIQVNE